MLALGIGAVLGAALLFSGPLEADLGTSGVAAVLVAALTVGLTTSNVVELLGGSSGRGGSYGLVMESAGGLASFLTGWGTATAQAAMVAALLIFVGRTVGEALTLDLSPALLALGLLLVLGLIQVFQYGRGRGLSRVLFVSALALWVSLFALALQGWTGAAARPTAGVNTADIWREAGRLIVLYLAVEAILASRRQIRTRSVSLTWGLVSAVIAGALLAALALLVGAGIEAGGEGDSLLQALAQTGQIPRLYVAVGLSLAALFTAGTLVLLGARQINDMSRRGALPQLLGRPNRPFVLPPLLFVVFGALVSVLIFSGRFIPLVDVAAWMAILTLIFVNIAAMSSRRNEPERRRIVEIPFFPLVPALAIGLSISLLLNLAAAAQAVGIVWVGIGVVVYLAYSRQRQAAAQEGVTMFGSDQRIEKEEGVYRVLVPLAPGERREFLLEMAAALAKQLGGDVMPLQVIRVADPMEMEQGRRQAKERNQLFRWSTRLISEAGVPVYPVTRLARTVHEGIVDTVAEEQCDLVLMPWVVSGADRDEEAMGEIIDVVVSRAQCHVAIVTYRFHQPATGADEEHNGSQRPRLRRLLVPTAGGPHAPLALGLAWSLGREFQAEVVAAYVAPEDASQAEIHAGEAHIRRTLEGMEASAAEALQTDEQERPVDFAGITTQVVRAEGVLEGILQASDDADMVLIGASEESLIDQMLFGNLPRRVAAECEKPVVMVRRRRALPRMWIQRTWEAAYKALPTLGDAHKIDVYKQVRRGARPDADFFIMMGVATLIGTIGLMQNSAAVIIGSMLVAPLFTPILAVSLGLAQGDVRMLRVAIEAMVKGVFLGVAVATLTAWTSPLKLATDEILLRTQPNLFDLGVALAAGVAGAYAIAREQVAAALPGVAIAAALVPPIGVVGFGLAMGDLGMAGGASLLVMTNLIAIAMAGSITLLLLGFRPGRRAERGERLRRGLTVTLILLIVIAVPLAAFFGRAVRQTRTEKAIRDVLSDHFGGRPAVQFVDFEFTMGPDEIEVEVTVWAESEPPAETADQLAESLNDVFGRRVTLRIVAIQIRELEAEAE